MAREISWFVADFETTSYEFYEKNGYTKVWLWAVSNSEGEVVKIGATIEEFMQYLKELKGSTIYFHNLRFDGSFIINYLFKHDYEWQEKLLTTNNKGFSSLIGEEGQYYQIKINFKRGQQVVIQDSLKIMPLSVRELAKAFNLPMEKEKIDYEDYEITDEKISYVSRDVQIVALALKFFKDNQFNKMTIGSNAYHKFKESCSMFDELFPKLKRDWLIEWRRAYRGGRSQVNPKFQNKVIRFVRRYDINSMYPYALATFPMPYGKPIKCNKPGKFKFELYKVHIGFKLKKGHLPTLLKKGALFNKKGETYYTETDLVEVIYISNVDLELVKKHYNVYYLEFEEIWGFKTSTVIFKDFIEEYYALKNSSDGGMKQLYKLVINNLYGKYGSKCEGKQKIPVYRDSKLGYELSKEQEMQCYYLPVAIAVTSWCHKLIDDAIMTTGYDNFVYCDTDSVHTVGTLPDKMVDPKQLGKFKLEGIEDTAKYVRQKCYVHYDPGAKTEYTITCAGMTEGNKQYLIRLHEKGVLNVFEEFRVGLAINQDCANIRREEIKLRPIQVPGGCVLKPSPFSLT